MLYGRAAGRQLRGAGPPCAPTLVTPLSGALVAELELGELLGEAGVGAAGADLLERGEIGVELLPVAATLKLVAAPEPELGCDLVLVQQADIVDRTRQRFGGLDLDPPVALEAGGGWNELADDDVLLETVEAVDLAFERRVGELLARLLEEAADRNESASSDALGIPRMMSSNCAVSPPALLTRLVDLGELEAVDDCPGR